MYPPVVFDEIECNGCNICVDICPMDIFGPNPVKGKPPIVLYGDECRYCGACWMRCARRKNHALRIVVPPAMRVSILRNVSTRRR